MAGLGTKSRPMFVDLPGHDPELTSTDQARKYALPNMADFALRWISDFKHCGKEKLRCNADWVFRQQFALRPRIASVLRTTNRNLKHGLQRLQDGPIPLRHLVIDILGMLSMNGQNERIWN